MKNPLLFFALFCLPVKPLAQNLVVNGGFERENPEKNRYSKPLAACSFSSNPEVFDQNVEAWHTYRLVTPDILELDSAQAATCSLGLPRPRKGKRMLGLIMFHPGTDGEHEYDYHEYVEGKLAQSLMPGKKYRVSFWVRAEKELGKSHLQKVVDHILPYIEPVLCNNFGFYFSMDKSHPSEDFRRSIFLYDIQPQINFEEIVETPSGEWRKMSAVFVPDRPFRYFVFGNFKSDGVTKIDLPDARRAEIEAKNMAEEDRWKRTKRIAYYCFDDFSVVEEELAQKHEASAPPQSAKTVSRVEQALKTERKITFSATVLFDFDQSSLKPAAFPELDELADFLRKNASVSLEIGGHTDNAGSDAYNLDLSERRARAVCDYLAGRGIETARLVPRGYGEASPVADNGSEAGQATNRRVECRVIDR